MLSVVLDNRPAGGWVFHLTDSTTSPMDDVATVEPPSRRLRSQPSLPVIGGDASSTKGGGGAHKKLGMFKGVVRGGAN